MEIIKNYETTIFGPREWHIVYVSVVCTYIKDHSILHLFYITFISIKVLKLQDYTILLYYYLTIITIY